MGMTREKAIDLLDNLIGMVEDNHNSDYDTALHMAIKALEQEPQTFKWCTDCKEYDQEKHCCHRWSKVIRDTVEEMKQESKADMVAFHCGVEESGFHAYNCNNCPNKCEEWYQWDKEMTKAESEDKDANSQ